MNKYINKNLVPMVVQDFYILLNEFAQLAWLHVNYRGSGHVDPLEEWNAICKKIRTFTNTMNFVVSMALIFLMFTGFIMYCLHYSHSYDHFLSLVILMLIVTSICMCAAYALSSVWEEILEGWFKAQWTTVKFIGDVRRLFEILQKEPREESVEVRSIFDYLNGFAFMSGGSPSDIPRGVITGCEVHLFEKVRAILEMEKEPNNGSPNPELDNQKVRLNADFELMKRFTIMPSDRKINHYYRLVQQMDNSK